MGLGFSSIAQVGQPTFFENLVSQGSLSSNVFSLQLDRGSDSSDATSNLNGEVQVANAGTLIFGGVDSSMYTGSLVYQDVTVKAYWETEMGGIAVNGSTSVVTGLFPFPLFVVFRLNVF